MSYRRHLNTIVSIFVDGAQCEGVQGVRSAIFDHFSQHFKWVDVERPGLGEIVFNSLSNEEGADLIKPFLLEEIKEAVWDCIALRVPGLMALT